MGVGCPYGGAKEARSPSCGAREAPSSQGHCSHSGDGVSQAEPATSGAAAGVHVGNDSGGPLGRDVDVGGTGVGDGHNHPGLEDHTPGFEGFPGGADAPREGLYFSGKTLLSSSILRPFLSSLALALIAARLQGMGIVKDSLPPVREDKELRAKNRARNEEQKKAKEEKKAKSARKAQRRETADKNRREAETAGLPAPDSPETSVSEVEGGGDTH